MSSGVTTFFRDLPIFPYSRVTGCVVPRETGARAVLADDLDDLLRGHVGAAGVGVGPGLDVALVEQPAERLLGAHVAQVVQDLVPEAGVQQVQDGVLDAADVQVDAARVGDRLGPSALPSQ
jgi:hypothetical protein